MKNLILTVTFVILLVFNGQQSNAQIQIGDAIRKLKEKIEERMAVVYEIPDAGISNETHLKYVGQIVWSNERISFQSPDESKFKTTFYCDEFILGRFYLPKSLQREIYALTGEIRQNIEFYYDCYVDGKLHSWQIQNGSLAKNDHLMRTTQQVWIYYTKENPDEFSEWYNFVKFLSVGEHTVKIDLRVMENSGKAFDNIFASGSFKLIKKKNYKLKAGKTFADFSAGMEDNEIEADILDCVKSYAEINAWKETYKSVKIKSTEWGIKKDELTGDIVSRSLVAYCYATWPNGKCSVQSFIFTQDNNEGSYSKTYSWAGEIDSSLEYIECE